MIKFLHAADLHLDSPFRGLSPEQATLRRQTQRAQISELCELAEERVCDLVLLAGDLFDSDGVYRDTGEALLREFSTCRAQIFISPGNHDFYASGSPYAVLHWPENVHIFRHSAIEAVPLPSLGITVYGAAFTGPEAHPLLENFHADGPAVMVLHGDPETAASPYNAISRQQISQSGLAYLALGHLHTASGLRREGGTFYAWPGCSMGRGFDECGEKGVYFGQLDGSRCELEFLPLHGGRYEQRTVEVDNDPLAALTAALPQAAPQDIYRVELTGQAPSPDVKALTASFASRFFALTLRDRTVPPRALWETAGSDSLQGLFLESLHNSLDKTDDPRQKRLLQQAALLGLDILEGREVPPL